MLLQETKTNVERSENFVESTFKFKTTAKAFRILSAGLYSDKIRAIIRELGTNAADSHIMAGKANVQFHVHLPNIFEPWFSINDFGTGLSPQDIEGIYTTYFDSNKNNSNDVTGCLGLGSKSPFGYTDNFTVNSRHNGKRYTYTAFLNEYGIPSIANLAEEDTNECNGVEICFPVEEKDFHAFTSKARDVYQHFTVRPVITGQTVDFNETKCDYSGSNWKVYRGRHDHTLIMGNVAYPVDLSAADCRHELFNNIAIYINCDIGEAEMTASRESLEYTSHTNNVIKRAVDEAVEQWTNLVLDELASKPTYWDACSFYSNNRLWIKSGTEWRGRVVASEISITPLAIYPATIENYGMRVKYYENDTVCRFNVKNKQLFVDNDLERGTKLRCMAYVRNINNKVNKLHIVNFENDAERQRFITELDLPANMMVKASSLPKVKYARNGNYTKKVLYELKQTHKRGRGLSPNWDKIDYDDGISGVYVELDHWQPIGYDVDILNRLQSCLNNIGKPIVIYGVRKGMIKRLNKNLWRSMDEVINNVVKDNESFKDEIMNCVEYHQYNGLLKLKGSISGIDITKLLDKIEYVSRNFNRLSSLRYIISRVVKSDDTITQMVEFEKIKKKYPLVFFIFNNLSDNNLPTRDLVNYINMINKLT